MSLTTYLITGANRGLGLGFVQHILATEPNSRVVAAARNPAGSEDLQKLVSEHKGRIETLKLDVSDKASIEAAAEQAGKLELVKGGIDIVSRAGLVWLTLGDHVLTLPCLQLFNNAGLNAVGTANVLQDDFVEGLEKNLQVK